MGFEVIYLFVNRDGIIDLICFEIVLCDDIIFVFIMVVNNEIGVL